MVRRKHLAHRKRPPRGDRSLTLTAANRVITKSNPSVIVETPSELPSGVTLQAIDGETMLTSTTMSNDYYARNGLTAVTDNPNFPGLNWDDLAYFPISVFYGCGTGGGAANMATFADINANASFGIFGDYDGYALMVANGIAGMTEIFAANDTDQTRAADGWPDCIIGMHIDDWITSITDMRNIINNTTLANQQGRIWEFNTGHNAIQYGDFGGIPMRTLLSENYFTGPSGGGPRSIDVYSLDLYFFTIHNDPAGRAQAQGIIGGSATAAEVGRGSHYGGLIDCHRSFGNGTNTGGVPTAGLSCAPSRLPFVALIDNSASAAYWTPNPYAVLPPEEVWATWSSIIHGCRGFTYFVYLNGFNTSILGGQTVSEYNAMKETFGRIKQLAPVINSPFAKGYVTVSPHGYVFPTYETNWLNGGIECCAHWDGNNFYIFATTRYAESVTDTEATFTLASSVTSTLVTVIGEDRVIPIINHVFTDTFANAWTVHLYRVENFVPFSGTVTEDFATVENPISVGGKWVHRAEWWANIKVVNIPPHVAAGTQDGSVSYNDSYAYLSPTVWPPSWTDYTVQATVRIDTSGGNVNEWETLVRVTDTVAVAGHGTVTAYELNCDRWGNYAQFVSWDGPGGDSGWTILVQPGSNLQELVTGDVLKSRIQGNVLTAWRNATQVNTYTDGSNLHPTGQPGIGLYYDQSDGGDNHGFTAWSVTSAAYTAPVVPDGSFSAAHTITAGTVIGQIPATHNPATWAVTGCTPSSAVTYFTIDAFANLILTAAGQGNIPAGTYTLTVYASNAYGNDSATITVNVT